MNWPLLHVQINHFPIILTIVGSAVLLLALIVRQRAVWLYALVTLTLAGLSVGPVYYTGGQAGDAVQNTWYVVDEVVDTHDDSAMWALISILLMGAASAYAWWRMVRREPMMLPPTWLRVVIAALAAFSLSTVIRTAYLGGQIVHESPRLATPPAGVVPSPSKH
jgi:formate hydrogenlyase subunit 3/multisubunit Na+/H+ antiporter MnhD subunit